MKKSKVSVQSVENFDIPDNAMVTVHTTQNQFEVVYSGTSANSTNTKNTKSNKKKNNRIRDGTSTPKECKTIDDFLRSYKKLLRIIKFYFQHKNAIFITLTYSAAMEDIARLSLDYKNFIRKFRRRYKDIYSIYIREPQNNGSWHIHCIIRMVNNTPINITSEELTKMWRMGQSDVRDVYNINGICEYFNITKQHKRHLLTYYPPNMRIYGCSKNMKIEKFRTPYSYLDKYKKSAVLTDEHSKVIDIRYDDFGIINPIKHEYYLIQAGGKQITQR